MYFEELGRKRPLAPLVRRDFTDQLVKRFLSVFRLLFEKLLETMGPFPRKIIHYVH